MIRRPLVLFGGALAWSMTVGGVSGQSPNADVALAPFAVPGDKANELRPVADGCLGQLNTALAGKGLEVSRLASLDEKPPRARRRVEAALSRSRARSRARDH